MNLLSFFVKSGFPTPMNEYSIADATGGQYEGYAYLGMGILMPLLFFLVSKMCQFFCILNAKSVDLRKSWPLLALMIVVLMIAISNKAYLGRILLFDFELPGFLNNILNIFRSSGRFIWLLIYLILLLVIVSFANVKKKVAGLLLLSVFVVIQFIDIHKVRGLFLQKSLSSSYWLPYEPMLSRYKNILISPNGFCTKSQLFRNFNAGLALYAALEGKEINTFPSARPVVGHQCIPLREALAQDFEVSFNSDILYIYHLDGEFKVDKLPEPMQKSCKDYSLNNPPVIICSTTIATMMPEK